MVIVSTSCVLVLAWPLFMALRSENPDLSLLLLIVFAACVGSGMAPYSTWLAEERPRFLRASWMGVTYNIAAGILGGSTPLLAGLLIERFHSLMAPAVLLMVASIVTILLSLLARETNRKALH
jgi:predicted MFS family arabinose efflux permease